MTAALPNILVTGVPGSGKTTFCEQAETLLDGFKHVNVSQLIKDKNLHEKYDETFETLIFDEDKLCDELEDMMAEGGILLDFHSCDFFPERWFDLVLVLRPSLDILHERLTNRGYSDLKIQENMQCEIMEVVAEEARSSYPQEIVQMLPSNTIEDMESNLDRLQVWLSSFRS